MSNALTASYSNFDNFSKLARNTPSIKFVEQLPTLSQMTFGGAPHVTLIR